ncbi:MAG: hypothetical protein ABFE07_05815 [Armatimonadia bacterium]
MTEHDLTREALERQLAGARAALTTALGELREAREANEGLLAEIKRWQTLHDAQRPSLRIGAIVEGLLNGSVLDDGAWWREIKIEHMSGSVEYPWRVRFGRRRNGIPRLCGWRRHGLSCQDALERLLGRAQQEG